MIQVSDDDIACGTLSTVSDEDNDDDNDGLFVVVVVVDDDDDDEEQEEKEEKEQRETLPHGTFLNETRKMFVETSKSKSSCLETSLRSSDRLSSWQKLHIPLAAVKGFK